MSKNILFNYLIATLLIASVCLGFSYFYVLPWLKNKYQQEANLIFILLIIQALPYLLSIGIYYAFSQKTYYSRQDFYKNILYPLVSYLFLVGIAIYMQYFGSNQLIRNHIEKKLILQEYNYQSSKNKIKRSQEIEKLYKAKTLPSLATAERNLLQMGATFPEDIQIAKMLINVQRELVQLRVEQSIQKNAISKLEQEALSAMNNEDYVLAKNIYEQLMDIYPNQEAYADKYTEYYNKLQIATKKADQPSININEAIIEKNRFKDKVSEIENLIEAASNPTNTEIQQTTAKITAYQKARQLYLLNLNKSIAKEMYENLYLDIKLNTMYFPEYQHFKKYAKPVYVFTNVKYTLNAKQKNQSNFYLQVEKLYLTKLNSAFMENITLTATPYRKKNSTAVDTNANLNSVIKHQADFGKIEPRHVFLKKKIATNLSTNVVNGAAYYQLPNTQFTKHLQYLPIVFSKNSIFVPLMSGFYLLRMKSFIEENLNLSSYFLNILILYKLAMPIFLCVLFLNFFYLSWQQAGQLLYPHSILYVFIKFVFHLFLYISSIYIFAFLAEIYSAWQMVFFILFFVLWLLVCLFRAIRAATMYG